MTDPFLILIVDDNANNRFALRTILDRMEDVEVIEASSGSEALLRTLDRQIHLVLLDVQMPGMDGYETASHLQMTSRTREIPIVFLTAVYKAEEFVQRGFALGAVDYLTKPIDQNLLKNRVHLYQHLYEREVKLIQAMELLRLQDQALGAALDQANAANFAKGTFLANMSHEIRTPMNAIIGMTHLVLQTNLTDKQQQYLERTHSAATSLLGIINDILDFSKIEAGKLQINHEEFRLEEVLGKTTQLVALKAEEKGVALLLDVAADVPPVLVGDPLRLGQVLTNLCSNAVKFTDHGKIVVRVEPLPAEGPQLKLRFSVRDTGIGIAQEQARLLFLPFGQVDPSSTRRFAGTGLGLAICKHLVTMMGGAIWVESRPGLGSEFFFTADLDVGMPMDPAPQGPDAQSLACLQGARVLVVEDNEFNQQVAVELLALYGVHATLAQNGVEALAKAGQETFQAILMDLQMPVMDGYEATALLRQDPAHAGLPILAMTAHAMPQEQERCREIGMNDYITKPIDPEALASTLARWLQAPAR